MRNPILFVRHRAGILPWGRAWARLLRLDCCSALLPRCTALTQSLLDRTARTCLKKPTCGWKVQSVMTTAWGRLEIMCICTATCPALVALADVNTL